MKKLLIMMLALMLIVTGCENKEETKTNNEENNKINETEKTPSVDETPKEETITLENLESKLNEINLNVELTKMEASYVGADEGYKYKSGEAVLEVYKFDKNSEIYKKSETNQKLYLSAGNFSQEYEAVVKNGYAYMLDDNYPKQDEVKSLLEKLMQ